MDGFTYKEKTGDIVIEVKPYYIEERSIPDQDHYFYAYDVKITNIGNRSCQLLRRHWIINDGNGNKREIEGSGIEGIQPTILPSESFIYTSYCPLNSATGNMRGNYFFIYDNEEKLKAKIPVMFFKRS